MKALPTPAWLANAPWLHEPSGLKVAACESQGENAVDLMAALYLATRHHGVALNLSCLDDQRNAQVATSLATALAGDGTEVVIGHFGAVTALAAASVYDRHPLLFLAPGCSDPRLCSRNGPGRHALRLFGNDDEQADCLLAGIAPGSSVSIYAQRGNYGYRLGKAIHQRLSVHAATASISFLRPGERLGNRLRGDSQCILIAGACEFAEYVASRLPLGHGQQVLFSDDCRLDSAARLKLPVPAAVAALACDLTQPGQALFADLLEHATSLTGRRPGPYFLPSYLACHALCMAIRGQPDASAQALRAHMLGQRIASPYGMLGFDPAGNLQGHRWVLNRVPTHKATAHAACAV